MAEPNVVYVAYQPLDSQGRMIWIADAHRGDGNRFVDRADEKLTAFLELERVTRESLRFPNAEGLDTILAMQPFHGFPLATARIDCELPSNYS